MSDEQPEWQWVSVIVPSGSFRELAGSAVIAVRISNPMASDGIIYSLEFRAKVPGPIGRCLQCNLLHSHLNLSGRERSFSS